MGPCNIPEAGESETLVIGDKSSTPKGTLANVDGDLDTVGTTGVLVDRLAGWLFRVPIRCRHMLAETLWGGSKSAAEGVQL